MAFFDTGHHCDMLGCIKCEVTFGWWPSTFGVFYRLVVNYKVCVFQEMCAFNGPANPETIISRKFQEGIEVTRVHGIYRFISKLA